VTTAACTIVAKSLLAYARVLAASFLDHHPDLPFFVLIADEIDGCFDPRAEAFQSIELTDLAIPRAHTLTFRYSQQPLSYASTPFLLAHLLDRGFARVLFVKQESLILGTLDDVIEALARHPIAMTPHVLSPLDGPDRVARELNILQSGVFNVGLLGVSESVTARRFLAWWQDRVFAHCLHAVADGMHYEQRWLDLVPAYFEGAHVVRDPAINIGHWNLPERSVDVLDDPYRVLVDGRPCRLFRFSGYDPEVPHVPTRHSGRLTWDTLGPARRVFERYASLVIAAGHREAQRWPYAYDRFDNGLPIPDFVRQLYVGLGTQSDVFGDPRATTRSDSFFEWLRGPAAPGTLVSRLWLAIHTARVDLRAAFPDPLGADASRFVEWTALSGVREHAIPDAFLATCAS
jgi:hypothetical protein